MQRAYMRVVRDPLAAGQALALLWVCVSVAMLVLRFIF
jgi:hypothetical protein